MFDITTLILMENWLLNGVIEIGEQDSNNQILSTGGTTATPLPNQWDVTTTLMDELTTDMHITTTIY